MTESCHEGRSDSCLVSKGLLVFPVLVFQAVNCQMAGPAARIKVGMVIMAGRDRDIAMWMVERASRELQQVVWGYCICGLVLDILQFTEDGVRYSSCFSVR